MLQTSSPVTATSAHDVFYLSGNSSLYSLHKFATSVFSVVRNVTIIFIDLAPTFVFQSWTSGSTFRQYYFITVHAHNLFPRVLMFQPSRTHIWVSNPERVDPLSGSTPIPLQQRSCWAFSPADEVKASNLEFGVHFRYLSAFQDSAHLGLFMTFIHRLLCDSVLLVYFSRFSMLYSLHKFCPISFKFRILAARPHRPFSPLSEYRSICLPGARPRSPRRGARPRSPRRGARPRSHWGSALPRSPPEARA